MSPYPKIPDAMTAYKYCGHHGVDILQNLELKITPPNQFNDPFEFTPQMVVSNPLRRATTILRNKTNLKALYRMKKDDGTFSGNFREFQEYMAYHRRDAVKRLSECIPMGAAETRKELLDKASTLFGVLCLSERRDSILMWGHYADSHRGFVIGFDRLSDVFHPKVGAGLRTVEYVRQRVVYDATWDESDPKVKAFHDLAVFSKNDDWKYERELRQCFNLASLNPKLLINGQPGYFLSIPPTAIVSVSLGVRCEDDIEKKVRSALSQSCLSHVALDRAILDESEFALKFI